ncbi:hypothetical protein RO07_25595 [Pandoraea pulmonicola]|nr:hypothetical protein RO07_25595 [Pandoraea pulmonicola]
MIPPGTDWSQTIDKNIEDADLILLLVSPSFVNSDYCMEKELAIALQRHQAESAIVVPVFVRPADLHGMPFMSLQGLPTDAKSVSEWDNVDSAWLQVAKGVRQTVSEIIERKGRFDASSGEPIKMRSVIDAMTEAVEALDARYHSDAVIGGVSTGLVDLDLMTDGTHEGDLIVIASRPLMGRTTLALKIALGVASENLPVLIFSTKTSTTGIATKLLSVSGRIRPLAMERAMMTDADWPGLVHAVQSMEKLDVMLDDTVRLGFSEFREKCRSICRERGKLGLVLLDSIHYLGGESKNTDVSVVARELKSLARELHCRILVTANVMPTVETRPNKRPVAGDLGDWAVLGEESDVLLFTYVDSVYNPEGPDRDTAEIVVARCARGYSGAVRVAHAPSKGIFMELITPPGTDDSVISCS